MKPLTLRLPDDMHAALKAVAEHERRSMHAQILHMLAGALTSTSAAQFVNATGHPIS